MASNYDGPEPSPAFDGVHTTEEIEARYQQVYRERLAALKLPDGEHLPHPEHMDLLGDLRLAHLRKYREMHGQQPLRPGSTLEGKARPQRASVDVAPEGVETITCAVCTEELPATKFPTVSGRPGVRESTCRACKKATKIG